ncbi:hypothetical protein LZ30DRAFT_145603 [Colletotrichum cereale]|nr:hypothetical protein LZ30DRAFT_145603 [Colletotrichum cereale]
MAARDRPAASPEVWFPVDEAGGSTAYHGMNAVAGTPTRAEQARPLHGIDNGRRKPDRCELPLPPFFATASRRRSVRSRCRRALGLYAVVAPISRAPVKNPRESGRLRLLPSYRPPVGFRVSRPSSRQPCPAEAQCPGAHGDRRETRRGLAAEAEAKQTKGTRRGCMADGAERPTTKRRLLRRHIHTHTHDAECGSPSRPSPTPPVSLCGDGRRTRHTSSLQRGHRHFHRRVLSTVSL